MSENIDAMSTEDNTTAGELIDKFACEGYHAAEALGKIGNMGALEPLENALDGGTNICNSMPSKHLCAYYPAAKKVRFWLQYQFGAQKIKQKYPVTLMLCSIPQKSALCDYIPDSV